MEEGKLEKVDFLVVNEELLKEILEDLEVVFSLVKMYIVLKVVDGDMLVLKLENGNVVGDENVELELWVFLVVDFVGKDGDMDVNIVDEDNENDEDDVDEDEDEDDVDMDIVKVLVELVMIVGKFGNFVFVDCLF